MSINNLEFTSYNFLSNLATVNADEVNTNVLTKSDPDISDLQFDMLEGINTNETIQEQIDNIIVGIQTTGYWGAFWSDVDQTNAGATSVNLMTVNNSDPNNNDVVIGTTSSQIKVLNDGVYNIQFSAQFDKSDGGKDNVEVWFAKNGSNIPDSNSLFSLEGNNDKLIAALNFMLELNANDYIQIAWHSSDVNMFLHHDVAGASPTRPATPSVIITVQQVMNTMTGPQGAQGPTGAQGPQGTSGTNGAQGAQGTPGTPGGAQGSQGQQGAQGPPGGAQGAQGAQGAKGNQGNQGPAGDGPVAYSALALATTTAATLGGYIVSNNASQAAQDVSIGILQGEMNTAQGDINDLEQVTTFQTATTLGGTFFASAVTVGSPAVVELKTITVSEFGLGLNSSAAITSTAGTSQMSSLLVNNNFEVANDATITAGEMYITRTLLASQKKLVLYDNNTGNDYDYLGFWTDSGVGSRKFLNCEIDGDSNSAFQWFNGNGLGTSRTLMKKLNPTIEETFCGSSRFCKLAGSTQQIDLTRNLANNQVIINLMGDTAGVNTFDGQIIQDKGNSLDDNKGTMTIQSGGLALEALNTGVSIQATTSTLIQSVTTTTLTSGDETEINCEGLDINAGAGAITFDTLNNTTINTMFININATDDITINATLELFLISVGETDITCATLDLNASTAATLDAPTITTTSTGLTTINSAGLDINAGAGAVTCDTTSTITLTSTGETEINSGVLDINASNSITIDGGSTTTITSSQTMTLEVALGSIGGILIKTNDSANDIELTTIGASSDIKLLSTAATVTITAGTEADITCATLDLNASTAATLDAPTITLTSTGKFTLDSGAAETEINCGILDINATGAATLDATSLVLTASTGLISLNTAAGQDIQINAGDDLLVTSDQVSFTTSNTTGNNFIHTASVTSGKQMELKASTIDGYTARLSQTGTGGLTITGRDNGINLIKSNGAASTLQLESAQNMILTSVKEVTITSGAGYDVIIDGGQDVNITALAGGLLLNSDAGDIELDATGDINLTGSDINILMPTAGIYRVQNNSVYRFTVENTKVEVLTALNVTGATTCSSTLGVTGATTLSSTLGVTGLSTLTGGFTSSASSNMNHDFLIQQNTYPPTSTSALGYTGTVTVATSTLATSITQEGTWNLPSKGVWLVCSTVTFSTNSGANTEYFHAVISTTTNSATEASAGLSYFEEDDQGVAGSGTRDKVCLSGVVRVNAATALFFNASGKTTGTAPSVAAAITYTRLG